MSRRIAVDGPAGFTAAGALVVSDVEYAGIDWGNSADDVVFFNLENGGVAVINWAHTAAVYIPGAATPPGSYPGWRIDAVGPYGGLSGLNVSDAVKDALVTELSVADVIVEFTTLQGTDVRLPSRNTTIITFIPGDYVVPT
jgi:hypothetical protein